MRRRPLQPNKRLEAMRQAFDQSFAAAPAESAPVFETFLTIRLGKRSHALPLRDIGGLFARKPITRLPTAQPALLGLAHFRGLTAPVYDLQLLLGHAPAENAGWLAIANAVPVAFAFERFEGQARVAIEDILTDKSGGEGELPQQSIRMNGKLLPVVHLPTIIGTIENMMSSASGRETR